MMFLLKPYLTYSSQYQSKSSDKPSWSETFCRFYPFIAESFVNLWHPTFVRKLTCDKLIHIIIL